jgi:uncharacterized protein (TIGR02145 family)
MKQKILSLITILCFCAAAMAQISNTQADFSCLGHVTVTYDLNAPQPVDIILYYSHNKCDWVIAQTVSGDLTQQNTGTGKTIIWNNYADNVAFGKFYCKVEASQPPEPECPGVMINGVCWATCNLDVGGEFCANPEDYGALFQWGRRADGHESHTSPCWPTSPACGIDASSHATAEMLDANGQVICPAAPCGYFIRVSGANFGDWRTPQNNTLWNSGTETFPIKTANDPCPEGWRVPTHNELSSLTQTDYVTRVSTIQNGIWGYRLTDVATAASIFLPGASHRMNNNGLVNNAGSVGYYWSSIPNGSFNSYYLGFMLNIFFTTSYVNRAYGFSIRCVAE